MAPKITATATHTGGDVIIVARAGDDVASIRMTPTEAVEVAQAIVTAAMQAGLPQEVIDQAQADVAASGVDVDAIVRDIVAVKAPS